MVVLLAARAARLENQDAIDAAIVNMLADPKEVEYYKLCITVIQKFSQHSFMIRKQWHTNTRKVIVTCSLQARANITEVHFLPFNPVDKRTAITYIDSDGKFYRASKGAPEQVQNSLKMLNTYSILLLPNVSSFYFKSKAKFFSKDPYQKEKIQ